MRKGFITGGYWCVDRNSTIPRWPKENTATAVISSKLANGGSGANFAIDMKKLDPQMAVETITLVGKDEYGKFLFDLTVEYGIKNDQFHMVDGISTTVTDAYQSLETGLRTHITHSGSASLLTPDYFNLDKVGGKILHLGLPGIQELMDAPWQDEASGWVFILKKAKKLDLITNIELVTIASEKIRDVVMPCLPYLDMLIVNDYEIGALANMTTTDGRQADIERCKLAANIVLQKGAMSFVVIHFEDGALYIGKDGSEQFVPSINIPDAQKIGANGAGDAFAAGFLYGYHESYTVENSIRLAHASAAACLRSTSTAETVVSVKEVMDLATNWGWR